MRLGWVAILGGGLGMVTEQGRERKWSTRTETFIPEESRPRILESTRGIDVTGN